MRPRERREHRSPGHPGDDVLSALATGLDTAVLDGGPEGRLEQMRRATKFPPAGMADRLCERAARDVAVPGASSPEGHPAGQLGQPSGSFSPSQGPTSNRPAPGRGVG